jgi:hypothetical protein
VPCGGSTRPAPRRRWACGRDRQSAAGLRGGLCGHQPGCTPLLARKTAQAETLDELLFAMIVLGDDRLIEQTIVSQAK